MISEENIAATLCKIAHNPNIKAVEIEVSKLKLLNPPLYLLLRDVAESCNNKERKVA